MTDKSTRWAFTAFEDYWHLFQDIKSPIAEWGWQTEECPTTGKKHYQGFLRTQTQVRHKALRDLLPGVHIEVSKNWNALLKYCNKSETRTADSVAVHVVSKNRHMTMADALTALVSYLPTKAEIEAYEEAYPNTVYNIKDKYWFAINKYLKDTKNYESIGLFTNPQMLTAFSKTLQVWLDRQTDTLNAEQPDEISPTTV